MKESEEQLVIIRNYRKTFVTKSMRTSKT